MCRTTSDRLLRSIDDLRALFSDEVSIARAVEEFDVLKILSEMVDLLNLANRRSGLALEAPGGSPAMVSNDRQTVEQVFTRVLDTALKLSAEGQVRVGLENSAAGILLWLTPPDAGVALQLANWLNADPSQVQFEDAHDICFGVSAIVAGKQMRALGGTALTTAVSGATAGLVISLPSRRHEGGEQECLSRPDANRRDALNILVVEDCDESYTLLQVLLKNEHVWRARSGLEAIEFVKQHRYDIIFMDVHMPEMDGYRAIRAIRDWETGKGNARTPIVVLSSDDVTTQVRFAAEAGCSGYLRKPVRKAELTGLIERLKAVYSLTA